MDPEGGNDRHTGNDLADNFFYSLRRNDAQGRINQ